MEKGLKEIDKLKEEVIKLIIKPKLRKKTSFGARSADTLSKIAGSWTFIISFLLFLVIWILTQGYFILRLIDENIIDPYPYILLNLFLSCLAAIQAPIILMSQNRQSEKDRLHAEYDYQVNRKAEREIQEIKKQLEKIEKLLIKK